MNLKGFIEWKLDAERIGIVIPGSLKELYSLDPSNIDFLTLELLFMSRLMDWMIPYKVFESYRQYKQSNEVLNEENIAESLKLGVGPLTKKALAILALVDIEKPLQDGAIIISKNEYKLKSSAVRRAIQLIAEDWDDYRNIELKLNDCEKVDENMANSTRYQSDFVNTGTGIALDSRSGFVVKQRKKLLSELDAIPVAVSLHISGSLTAEDLRAILQPAKSDGSLADQIALRAFELYNRTFSLEPKTWDLFLKSLQENGQKYIGM